MVTAQVPAKAFKGFRVFQFGDSFPYKRQNHASTSLSGLWDRLVARAAGRRWLGALAHVPAPQWTLFATARPGGCPGAAVRFSTIEA